MVESIACPKDSSGEENFSIVRSPKSYNSQIGVPLSVLNINETNNLAIFEAGISQPGEMEKLEKIIKPLSDYLQISGRHMMRDLKTQRKKLMKNYNCLFMQSNLIFCADDR